MQTNESHILMSDIITLKEVSLREACNLENSVLFGYYKINQNRLITNTVFWMVNLFLTRVQVSILKLVHIYTRVELINNLL